MKPGVDAGPNVLDRFIKSVAAYEAMATRKQTITLGIAVAIAILAMSAYIDGRSSGSNWRSKTQGSGANLPLQPTLEMARFS